MSKTVKVSIFFVVWATFVDWSNKLIRCSKKLFPKVPINGEGLKIRPKLDEYRQTIASPFK
jgi:hypothetical protein